MTEEELEEYYQSFITLYPNLFIDTNIEGFTEEEIKVQIPTMNGLYSDKRCHNSKDIVLLMTANALLDSKNTASNGLSSMNRETTSRAKIGDLDIELLAELDNTPYPYNLTDYGKRAWKLKEECNRVQLGFMSMPICGGYR